MLPLSPLRFSTIGKPILRTFEILKIFRCLDNSSRTRAKARAKATARSMARATAMAKATARARRTRARAKDRARARARARDGRTDGAIYLAKCATPSLLSLSPCVQKTMTTSVPSTTLFCHTSPSYFSVTPLWSFKNNADIRSFFPLRISPLRM